MQRSDASSVCPAAALALAPYTVALQVLALSTHTVRASLGYLKQQRQMLCLCSLHTPVVDTGMLWDLRIWVLTLKRCLQGGAGTLDVIPDAPSNLEVNLMPGLRAACPLLQTSRLCKLFAASKNTPQRIIAIIH